MPDRARHHAGLPAYSRAYTGALRALPAPGEQTPKAAFLGGGHVAPLAGEVITIGRDLRNGVVLTDPTVSREHARLQRHDDHWLITNVSRTGGLLVGEKTLDSGASTPLTPGEIVALGSARIELVAPMRTAGDDTTGGSPTNDREAMHLLAPGITLQFALSARRGARLWWLVAGLVAALCVVSAVIAVGAAALVGREALAIGGLGRGLAAATVPLVPVLGAGALVAFLDRYERESVILLCAAFVWGAVIAIPPVLGLERLLLSHLMGGHGAYGQAGIQAVVAALVEESVKAAGLLALIAAAHDEFDNVTDGVLYGLLIGAGFSLAENFAYFALTPRADLGFLVLGRVMLGWLSHSTFTALVGAGLGYARERGKVQGRWRSPLLGFVAAVLLHAWFDVVVFAADVAATNRFATRRPLVFAVLALLAAYGPILVAQAWLLRLTLGALRREAEIVRAYLDTEVIAGVVTPEEYLLVQDAALRNQVERAALAHHGPRGYLTLRALHQAITGLAFRRWHVAQGDPAKTGATQPEDAYRQRIVRLRDSLLRQLAPANAEHQRVLGGGDSGDIILGVAKDQETAEGDELLIERVLDRAHDGRGQVQPADRPLLDLQAQIPIDDGDAGRRG